MQTLAVNKALYFKEISFTSLSLIPEYLTGAAEAGYWRRNQ